MLQAISPIDGRYRQRVLGLSGCFSEEALIRARCQVELRFLLAVDRLEIFPKLQPDEVARILQLSENFSSADAGRVKEIEKTTNHDVKALEYFLIEKLSLREPNRIHFGLTSWDANNLAYGLMFIRFVQEYQIPQLQRTLRALCDIAFPLAHAVFPARTHGQSASPTTAGKEIAVFASRLSKLLRELKQHRFAGKCNGATGTYASFAVAAPEIDWRAFSKSFVEELGIVWNPTTTQIEDYDSWSAWFHLTQRINNVMVDLDQDLWTYLMLGFFIERPKQGEVGSSTMPHKINPIRFENSEGNLLFANAMLGFFADKLARSRLQRDLSDSTVARNVGVAMAHSWLGIGETLSGMERVICNVGLCLSDVKAHSEVLAEAAQTILRREGVSHPYERLKEASRGKAFSLEDLQVMSADLTISAEGRARLMDLRPESYTGLAAEVCLDALDAIVKEHNL